MQRAFAPAAEEVAWSVRVFVANAKADACGRGAWIFEGKMVYVPVVCKARAVVERAARCGVDVDTVREEWKGQELE